MRNAVWYKDCWLCRGSTAYELHEAALRDPKEWKKLEQHMKQLDANERKLLESK